MTIDDLCCGSITHVASLLDRRAVSPVELTAAMIRRIERLDQRLHSYVALDFDDAMNAARSAERRFASGASLGTLDGIPLGIKDVFDTASMPTESGSVVDRGRRPKDDAFVVERLRATGAILVGKQATAEFAWVGYPAAVGPAPVNPWAADRTPGMSSGGSAVGVAAALCFGAFATDTGGSIRFPSTVNGIVGMKPTFGRVSRRGVHAFSATLDHVGPLARSVEDAALLYAAVAGHDPQDPFSASIAPTRATPASQESVRGVRLGLDLAYMQAFAEPRVVDATLDAVRRLEHAGMSIVPVDLIALPEVCRHFLPVAASEALQAFGRERFAAERHLMGRNMVELLSFGDRTTVDDLSKAAAARRRNDTLLQAAFEKVDYIALPGIGSRVPTLSMLPVEPDVPVETFSAASAFSAPFNFSGHPTLSLPNGTDEDGLPLGLQLVARPFDEAGLLHVGRVAERVGPPMRRPLEAAPVRSIVRRPARGSAHRHPSPALPVTRVRRNTDAPPPASEALREGR